MKKTLAALAVLGAFAGSAMAADVSVYGILDVGFKYVHSDPDDSAKPTTDSFTMAPATTPATASASRALKISATA